MNLFSNNNIIVVKRLNQGSLSGSLSKCKITWRYNKTFKVSLPITKIFPTNININVHIFWINKVFIKGECFVLFDILSHTGFISDKNLSGYKSGWNRPKSDISKVGLEFAVDSTFLVHVNKKRLNIFTG